MSEIRPGPKPKKRSVTAYTPQKPYLKLWQSPSTFFRDAVRHLKSTITKESAFEKPYLDLEYPTMHLNLPYPDWPRGKRFRIGDIAPDKGDLVTGSGCKYCIITCYGDMVTSASECDKAYGWCHISIACTKSPDLGEANPGDVGWDIEGPVLFTEEDGMDGIDIYVDWAAVETKDGWKTADFVATLTDGLGHTCTDEFSVDCKSECLNCTITGSSTVTRSSDTQYTTDAEEGCEISWSITGSATGVSISSTGLVTTTSSACGTFTVHAEVDSCSDSMVVRVSDGGKWHVSGCPSHAYDQAIICDAYCVYMEDYAICTANPVGSCSHGSIRQCASKVDSATGAGYTDKTILCYSTSDCSWNTCAYTDFYWCSPGQTAQFSYEYEWVC